MEVDGFRYPPSVMLTPHQVFIWEVARPSEITPSHLKFVELMNPPPEYVIVGVTHPEKVRPQIEDYLLGFGINYDIIETVSEP